MNLIKEFRQFMGLSLADFGKRVGCSGNAIWFYENYKRAPAWRTSLRIKELAIDHGYPEFTLDELYKEYERETT